MFNHLHNLNRKTVDYYISQGSPNQPFRNTPSYLGIANIATLTSAQIHGPVLQWCLAAAKSMISVPMTAYKSRSLKSCGVGQGEAGHAQLTRLVSM